MTHPFLFIVGLYRIVVSDYSAEYEYEQLNDTKHSDIINNINYIMDNISAK